MHTLILLKYYYTTVLCNILDIAGNQDQNKTNLMYLKRASDFDYYQSHTKDDTYCICSAQQIGFKCA